MQSRMLPHICESTIGVAMGKAKHGLPHFITHDFRRTARTRLAALGVDPHVAERKVTLASWGQLLLELEQDESAKVIPIAAMRRVAA